MKYLLAVLIFILMAAPTYAQGIAEKHFRAAAEQGDADFQLYLGMGYLRGTFDSPGGVPITMSRGSNGYARPRSRDTLVPSSGLGMSMSLAKIFSRTMQRRRSGTARLRSREILTHKRDYAN